MPISQEVKNLVIRKQAKAVSLLKDIEKHDKEYGTDSTKFKEHLSKVIAEYDTILKM